MKTLTDNKPHNDVVLCTAHNRAGKPCGRRPVKGWNVCRVHGAGGGRPATRPETIVKNALKGQELRDKANALIQSGADVLDLTQIAAMLHVVAGEVSEKRGDDNNTMQLLFSCLDLLRKTAETIERIRASKAFTKAESDWFAGKLYEFVEKLPIEQRPQLLEFIQVEILKLHSASCPIFIGRLSK